MILIYDKYHTPVKRPNRTMVCYDEMTASLLLSAPRRIDAESTIGVTVWHATLATASSGRMAASIYPHHTGNGIRMQRLKYG